MRIISLLPALLFALGLVTAAAPAAGAQCADCSDRAQVTRADLEAQAKAAEQVAASANETAERRHAKEREAAQIRDRLRMGDFMPGDRIVVSVDGDESLTDTFTVRAGQLVTLPNLPELSLQGVLRAEVEPHLQRHIERYVRNPVVRAHALVRLAVLGQINNPGFYALRSDALFSDIVMTAGGPTREADLSRMTVRRGDDELMSRQSVQAAMSAGTTLSHLGLRSGDEIVVGERPRRNYSQILTSGALLVGIVTSVIALQE